MTETLWHIDKAIFLFFNAGVANPVLDKVMPFITDVDNWTIPIVGIWFYLVLFGKAKGRWAALSIVLLIALSDQVSSSVIKPWIERLRPCHPSFPLDGARFLLNMKRSYSMPSSHAANITAMGVFFAIKYRRTRWIVIPIAVMICWSRIYVGVHYPSDVLIGALLGFVCAHAILRAEKLVSRLYRQWQKRKRHHESDHA